MHDTTADTWEDRAACQGADEDLFFGQPDKYGTDRHHPLLLDAGRAICSGCDVREECLQKALDLGPSVYGLWGGTTKSERERLLRGIRRIKCPVCAAATVTDLAVWQICLSCGHSWLVTARPTAQTREKADAAA